MVKLMDVFENKKKLGIAILLIGLFMFIAGASQMTKPGYQDFDFSSENLHEFITMLSLGLFSGVLFYYAGVYQEKLRQEKKAQENN